MLRILYLIAILLVFWTIIPADYKVGIRVAAAESSGESDPIDLNSKSSVKNNNDKQSVDNNNNDNDNDKNKNDNSVVEYSKKSITFLGLLKAGGIIGYIIIFLSFVAVAIVIEFLFTVRRDLIMPKEFADAVLQQLSQGQLGVAMQSCQENQSFLAKVLLAGMRGFEFGWEAVEKDAENTLEEEASRLYRKIEYLNVIGNITPMLGLLGTVVGMIIAFQRLAESGGAAKPTDLAEGIYLALITTVQGLIVALPALGLHSILSGRIASIVSETTIVVEQVLNPIKRSFLKKK